MHTHSHVESSFFQEVFTALKYFKIDRRVYDWIIRSWRFFILSFNTFIFHLARIDIFMLSVFFFACVDTYMNDFLIYFFLKNMYWL